MLFRGEINDSHDGEKESEGDKINGSGSLLIISCHMKTIKRRTEKEKREEEGSAENKNEGYIKLVLSSQPRIMSKRRRRSIVYKGMEEAERVITMFSSLILTSLFCLTLSAPITVLTEDDLVMPELELPQETPSKQSLFSFIPLLSPFQKKDSKELMGMKMIPSHSMNSSIWIMFMNKRRKRNSNCSMLISK